jgi:hypothetical protein
MSAESFLFGGAGTEAVAGTAEGAAATGYDATAGKAAVSEATKQASAGAADQMANYDANTAADTAGGAAATAKRANESGRAQAASDSDAAIAQAAKAAKTNGMMGGQAALAGSAQAASSYGTGMAAGQSEFNANVDREANLGSEMSNRLQSTGETESSVNQSNAANETSASVASASNKTSASAATAANATAASTANAANATSASEANAGATGTIGSITGAIAGIGSLFSDRRLKKDIKQSPSISDSLARIKSYNYRYKDSGRSEAGIMAQDAEKTEAAPAVVNTPKGKMIDTRRLTTINTAAIGEQGRRIKDIESMLRELKGVTNG